MGLRHRGLIAITSLLTVGALACGGGDVGQEGGASEEGETDVRTDEEAAVTAPDTTAAALWSHLQDADYQEAWQLWPDMGELYEGGEPHGMLLTTYLNPAAHDALTGADSTLPPGAIVVKENYKPDSTLAAVTVMYKSEGYDSEHDDWFWVKYLPDGSVDNDGKAAGRVPGCIQCHGGAADNDWIMTGPLAGS